MSSATCEPILRQYYSTFNGKPHSATEDQALDQLFHKDFTSVHKGKTYTRDQVLSMNADAQKKGSVSLHVIHIHKIGIDLLDAKYEIRKNGKPGKVIRTLYFIEDNKIVKAVEVRDDAFDVWLNRLRNNLRVIEIENNSIIWHKNEGVHA